MTVQKLWRWLVPGLIFQSVLIGGGYGTGAEIAQFFGTNGLVGGLLSAAVTLVVWCVMCAVTFEFCRVFKTYDYGSMMKRLLGPVAFLYDICYWLMFLIVMGVVNASAGAMFDKMGINQWVGIAILSVFVIYLVFKGTDMIERALSFWSYVLYAVYFIFMVVVFVKFGSAIGAEFAKGEISPNWFTNGIQYSFYNLVVVPLILYTVRDCKSRKEAVGQGCLAGLLGIVPGVMLLLTMGCDFSNVTKSTVPVMAIFDRINMPWLYMLFNIVLFGTLIETAAGFVKAVVDRVETGMKAIGKETPEWFNSALIVVTILLGVAVSAFGLLGLIVKGYGTSCWGFFVLYALPMCTLGVYMIYKRTRS